MSKFPYFPTNKGGMRITLTGIDSQKDSDKEVFGTIVKDLVWPDDKRANPDTVYNLYILSRIGKEYSFDTTDWFNSVVIKGIQRAIEQDMKWVAMHNQCEAYNDDTNFHYINVDSMRLYEIEYNVKDNSIRLKYWFAQPYMGCSNSTRMMAGAVYNTISKEPFVYNQYYDVKPEGSPSVLIMSPNSNGPEVFW